LYDFGCPGSSGKFFTTWEQYVFQTAITKFIITLSNVRNPHVHPSRAGIAGNMILIGEKRNRFTLARVGITRRLVCLQQMATTSPSRAWGSPTTDYSRSFLSIPRLSKKLRKAEIQSLTFLLIFVNLWHELRQQRLTCGSLRLEGNATDELTD
jgi:hypothetical protein